jgi:hypothetical protein
MWRRGRRDRRGRRTELGGPLCCCCWASGGLYDRGARGPPYPGQLHGRCAAPRLGWHGVKLSQQEQPQRSQVAQHAALLVSAAPLASIAQRRTRRAPRTRAREHAMGWYQDNIGWMEDEMLAWDDKDASAHRYMPTAGALSSAPASAAGAASSKREETVRLRVAPCIGTLDECCCVVVFSAVGLRSTAIRRRHARRSHGAALDCARRQQSRAGRLPPRRPRPHV